MKRVSLASFSLIFSLLLLVSFERPAQAAFGFGGSDKAETDKKADNVYELLRNHKELSKFVDLILDAGLKDLFQSKDVVVTVFAPNNEAISDISSANMKRIKANKENLQNFVKYHLVTGSRISSSAINGRKSSSAAANGQSIAIDGTSTKDPAKVNDGHIVAADLSAGSNVVHIISAALIPADLNEKKVEEKPAEAVSKDEKTKTPVVAPLTTSPLTANSPLTTKGTALSKTGATIPLGSSISVGTSAPLGSSLPVGSAVSAPLAPAPTPEPEQSKGFSLFGHHFGG